MNLNDLEARVRRGAEGLRRLEALPPRGRHGRSILSRKRSLEDRHCVEEFQEAATPDVVLALIAVAKMAKRTSREALDAALVALDKAIDDVEVFWGEPGKSKSNEVRRNGQ